MLDDSLQNAKNRVVGLKQTQRALTRGTVERVYLAEDAEEKVRRPLEASCRQMQVQIVGVPSMAELGKACGIQVGTAVAAILKA